MVLHSKPLFTPHAPTVARQVIVSTLPWRVAILFVLNFDGLPSQLVEPSLHVYRILCRCFEKYLIAIIFAETAALFIGYLSLAFEVDFVSEDQNWNPIRIFWRAPLDEVLEPGVDIFKGLRVSDIVDDAAAVGPSIKRRTQALEPLLPRRIPNLQNANAVVFELYFSVCEIGSNGWFEVL